MMIKCIKEVCNWEPDVAEDGREALRLYTAYASAGYMYVCICMDTHMPNMNGFDTALSIREIEQRDHNERTFILGLYKEYDADAKNKCLLSGMDRAALKTDQSVKACLSEVLSLGR
jgi:CheY-like chemotaxis protein